MIRKGKHGKELEIEGIDLPMDTLKELYDKNLARVMEKIALGDKATYRIQLDSSGLVEAVERTKVVTRPQRNCFTLIVPGNAERAKFGSLVALDEAQRKLAQTLIQDVDKILETNEMAYLIKSARPDDEHSVSQMASMQVEELRKRFGDLPEPETRKQELEKQSKTLALQMLEAERQEVWNEESVSFEDLLKEELERERASRESGDGSLIEHAIELEVSKGRKPSVSLKQKKKKKNRKGSRKPEVGQTTVNNIDETEEPQNDSVCESMSASASSSQISQVTTISNSDK